MKKTIEILVGIPCSGKSTYTYSKLGGTQTCYVSRDRIRESLWFRYDHSPSSEKAVTEKFNELLEYYLTVPAYNTIILDNTHCKEKYIDEIIRKYGVEHNIVITYFDISLFKAHYRNIIRYFKIGKWIPLKVMNQMYRNYKKINRKKYIKYELI